MEYLGQVIVLYFVFNLIMCSSYNAVTRALTDIDYEEVVRSFAEYYVDLDLENMSLDELNRAFPVLLGTNWCGPGNDAKHDDDLGLFEDTDRCCRAHDKCEPAIEPGQTKFNLTNTAIYTRLSCECDENFYRCLRKVNSSVSKSVGFMYFNVIGTQCFREDFPIKECKKKGGLTGQKCVEYSYLDGPKVYSWFDVPFF